MSSLWTHIPRLFFETAPDCSFVVLGSNDILACLCLHEASGRDGSQSAVAVLYKSLVMDRVKISAGTRKSPGDKRERYPCVQEVQHLYPS
eukprot:533514-Amphidinium_carterae.1